MKLFSERYKSLLASNSLVFSVSEKLRGRISRLIDKYNDTTYDQWNNYSSITKDTEKELLNHYGSVCLTVQDVVTGEHREVSFDSFIHKAEPQYLLDLIELYSAMLPHEELIRFQNEINEAFDADESPIRLLDGEAYKLDDEIIKMRHVTEAFHSMEAGAYGGALAELREALRDLSMHDNKGAILNSAKAFESVMKQILRKTSGNYMQLVHELYEKGFYDNIPEEIRDGFKESVFVPLSVMRNRMGGHGQGAESYEIPRHYAELAVNIATSYLKFMMDQVACGQSKFPDDSQEAGAWPVVSDADLPF